MRISLFERQHHLDPQKANSSFPEAARAALPLTPADLYAEYVKYREVLGYS